MNKSLMAELYSKKDYPIDEFISLPAFISLENEPDVIESIEEFRLPEITKLICCSSKLAQLPWAEKYTGVRHLYRNALQVDAAALFSDYPDSKDFARAILDFADGRLLSSLLRVFDQLKEEKKRLLAEKKTIDKNRTELEKANLSPSDYESAKLECDRKFEEAEKRIASIESFVKTWKKHHELIKKAQEKNSEEATELRRSKAYEILFPSIAAEEVFLKQFIRDGFLSDEMRTQLQSETFCESILRYMDHGSYQGFALPVMMRLYEQGAVDLEAPFMMEYIRTHAPLVSDYLCEKFYELFENDASDDRALFDVVIKIESTYSMDASSAIFNVLWNTIKETDLWITVLQYAADMDLADIHDAVYAFMKGLDNEASEALVEALFMPQAQEMHIAATEVIGSALRNGANISPVIITAAFQKMEQLSRSAQRKLRTADRKLNGQGQNLFSSVYAPVERLEIIASNLRMSKGDIPCQLVANELVDIVTSLRAGMLQMNLHPVVEVDDWRRGYPLPFNAELHRKPMNAEEDPEKIILQTMGFRYLGDDGEWQQYNAQVITKPVRNPNSDASNDGNHQSQDPQTEHREPKKKERTKRGANKDSTKNKAKQDPSSRTTPKKPHRKGQKGGPKQ